MSGNEIDRAAVDEVVRYLKGELRGYRFEDMTNAETMLALRMVYADIALESGLDIKAVDTRLDKERQTLNRLRGSP